VIHARPRQGIMGAEKLPRRLDTSGYL
jgi:hypothetical protein